MKSKFLVIFDNPPGSRIIDAWGVRHALNDFDETKAGDEYALAVTNLTDGAPGLEAATLPPLFIPLDAQYFEAFERGEKTEEFRPYGPGVSGTSEHAPIGRRVVLSYGYGKARRLAGRIVSFRTDANATARPGWVDCYGPAPAVAACIGIEIEPNTKVCEADQKA